MPDPRPRCDICKKVAPYKSSLCDACADVQRERAGRCARCGFNYAAAPLLLCEDCYAKTAAQFGGPERR